LHFALIPFQSMPEIWRRCPGCHHKWFDKYRFDECPRCLGQLSKLCEQEELFLSTARNQEPPWSLSTSQKMERWSSTLRDTIHSRRTPRHNPSITARSPNPGFPKNWTKGIKGTDIGSAKALKSTRAQDATPIVSPASHSSIANTPPSLASLASLGLAGSVQLPVSLKEAWEAQVTHAEESAREEAATAKAEAEAAKSQAAAATELAHRALAEVERLRKLLEENGAKSVTVALH